MSLEPKLNKTSLTHSLPQSLNHRLNHSLTHPIYICVCVCACVCVCVYVRLCAFARARVCSIRSTIDMWWIAEWMSYDGHASGSTRGRKQLSWRDIKEAKKVGQRQRSTRGKACPLRASNDYWHSTSTTSGHYSASKTELIVPVDLAYYGISGAQVGCSVGRSEITVLGEYGLRCNSNRNFGVWGLILAQADQRLLHSRTRLWYQRNIECDFQQNADYGETKTDAKRGNRTQIIASPEEITVLAGKQIV